MSNLKAEVIVLAEAEANEHLNLVKLWAITAYENMRDYPLLKETTAIIGCFACQAGVREDKKFLYIIKKMSDGDSNEYGHTFYYVDNDYRALASRATEAVRTHEAMLRTLVNDRGVTLN